MIPDLIEQFLPVFMRPVSNPTHPVQSLCSQRGLQILPTWKILFFPSSSLSTIPSRCSPVLVGKRSSPQPAGDRIELMVGPVWMHAMWNQFRRSTRPTLQEVFLHDQYIDPTQLKLDFQDIVQDSRLA
ncbi:hypothetical protein PGTUg99_031677 [Puccinia graminis f. sp. tritici]|uniref:Uncharacterized protein n=1 Tax=Puccinia graminis f. sp. tritici TaxID=56615 RepID=A0A5B0QRC9_PUCGR|nr:hypothetical protein PGTUg99_031677 [Puccinia graminis f. sp. tritici]